MIYRVACTMDSPPVLDCLATPIPGSGSSPLEVVAFLPKPIQKIVCQESTGRFIGIFEGDEGEETLVGIAAGEQHVYLQAGSRVSLRNLEADEIVSGGVFLQFMESI
jgi:hypothetical protein